jgi:transcriptional regulator with XRE-family HTH domain
MLKRLRESQGKTHRGLATELGVHRNFVYYIESGQRDIGVAELLELLQTLGVEPSDFFREFLTEVEERRAKGNPPQS